jgi:methylase of polypeptide subunit release factors
MNPRSQALVDLGRHLKADGYRFTAITPLSHSRVRARNGREGHSLTDVFGWSLCFREDTIPQPLVALLDAAGELAVEDDGLLRSQVRFATLGDQLYVHSAYPTTEEDAVFFGPDTYRFARTIREFMPPRGPEPTRIIDIGSGSGAGGIVAATLAAGEAEVIFVDINDKALRYSEVNALINGGPRAARYLRSDVLQAVPDRADIIVSNPPYLVDPAARAYRHGGARGFDLSLKVAEQGLDHLAPGGRLILYTGTPVVAGADQFRQALSQLFQARGQSFSYQEIDPDVFGEELDSAPYQEADRIAVVSVVADAAREAPR